jgi:hypothetical protein
MILESHVLDRIATGTIRRAFRRWRRPTVRAGGTLRTAVGVLAIDALEPVALDALTEEDARLAGFESLAALTRDLESQRPGVLYRIDLHWHGPDARVALREAREVSPEELEDVAQRLRRLDARSPHGAWTLQVLTVVRQRPGVRAGDLAVALGRERLDFKRDVRKLKELGLTESLEIGYRLSPRGETVLEHLTTAVRDAQD